MAKAKNHREHRRIPDWLQRHAPVGTDEQHGYRINHNAWPGVLHGQVTQFLAGSLCLFAPGNPVEQQGQNDPNAKSNSRPHCKKSNIQITKLGVNHQLLMVRQVFHQFMVGPRPEFFGADNIQLFMVIFRMIIRAQVEYGQPAQSDECENQAPHRQGACACLQRTAKHIAPVACGTPLNHQQHK